MKSILFYVSAVILAPPTIISFIELYSEKQVNKLVSETINYITYNRGLYYWTPTKENPLPQPIYLGSMLYANIHANRPDTAQWWGAGPYTDKSYKTGWKVLIAKNPELAYKSIDLFGKSFITSLNKQLVEIKNVKLSETGNNSFNLFTTEKYWKQQKIIICKYESLVDSLLSLDDATLKGFLNSLGKEQDGFTLAEESYSGYDANPPANKLKEWLHKKGLIGKIPENSQNYNNPFNDGGWYYEMYPVDLLLLTYRVGIDFPEWNNRRFLEETKKLITKIKELI